MTRPDRPWPPLVVAENVPRLVRWRDVGLTVVIWMIFAIMLTAETQFFIGRLRMRLGLAPDVSTDPNWAEFFDRLWPFIVTTFALVVVLFLASVLTQRRRVRALATRPPPPLAIADQARRAGMEESALAAARELRIVVVHIDADGRHRIDPREARE
jgi:poly-beta-1,6-N-acetyl-D-glucosamine biosynthesis protein PgaD